MEGRQEGKKEEKGRGVREEKEYLNMKLNGKKYFSNHIFIMGKSLISMVEINKIDYHKCSKHKT